MYNLGKDFYKEFCKYLEDLDLGSTTVRFYRSDANRIIKWFAKANYWEFDKNKVKKYIDFLRKQNTPARTINRRLSTLRHLSGFLKQKELIKKDFMRGIKNIQTSYYPNVQLKNSDFNIDRNFTIVGSLLLIFGVLFNNNQTIKSPFDEKLLSKVNSDTTVELPANNFRVEVPEKINKNTVVVVLEEPSYQLPTDSDNLPLVLSSKSFEYKESKDQKTGNYVLPAGRTSVLLNNLLVTSGSQIFITPASSTLNQVLYVSDQGEGYFIVSVETPIKKDIEFNWWIVN